MLARMDEKSSAEARQLVVQVALELEKAAEAARRAVSTDDRAEAWKQLQQLYTRFDQAAQLLRDMRRTVDAAFPPH